ncbi:unnamed protein product [Arctia plantaginis]|uniref:Uncharacterized protein n=1 Tax=Arctia plantaginis TaxID=874455 RepID=A0A8S1ADI6_ARCPL|nr:unnamed protein product [Arctia plantaginis]
MGTAYSKDDKRRIDEATSNSSLSNLRYVITEKPKWKVFKKKEIVPLPKGVCKGGCPCGNDGPCKQKVTPNGVTIHYPQPKKKKYILRQKRTVTKTTKSYLNTPRPTRKVKVVRPKKLLTWRLDSIKFTRTPFTPTPPATTNVKPSTAPEVKR